MILRKPLALAAPLALILALPACQPRFGYLEITVKSSPPVPVSVRDQAFEIPVGIAVLIHAEPVSDNMNDYVATDDVDLITQKSAILDVEPGPDDRTFVLVGVSPGDTCVDVFINGSREECIPATVLAPM